MSEVIPTILIMCDRDAAIPLAPVTHVSDANVDGKGFPFTTAGLLGLYAETGVFVVGVHCTPISATKTEVVFSRIWRPHWIDYVIHEDGRIKPLQPSRFIRMRMIADKELHQKLCELRIER